MEINVKKLDGCTEVSLVGMLDSSSSSRFNSLVEELLSDGSTDVVLALGELEYISSRGLRQILSLMKGVNAAGGTLVFKDVKPAVMDVFRMTGLNRVMTFSQSAEQ